MSTSREPNHEEIPLLPGGGGLDTRTDAALIADQFLADVENLTFDEGGAKTYPGYERLLAFDPNVAGLRISPNPLPRVARTYRPQLGLPGVVPYSARLTPSGEWQIDFSFRIESPWDQVLTGADQTENAGANRVGRVGAPAGGEFQFSPLITRGGDEVTRLSWTIGVVVARPAGYGGSGSPETGIMRLVLLWWDDTNKRLRYNAADRALVAGHDYHVSLQIGTLLADRKWFLGGVEVAQVPTTDGASALPAPTDIDWSRKAALYFGGCPREGKWPGSELVTGLYDLTGAVYTGGAPPDTIQHPSLQAVGRAGGSWVGYYVRVTQGTDAGIIRRIASFNGTDTVTLAADFPTPAAFAASTFDVVPPMECSPMDVVLGEVRFWRRRLSTTEIGRLLGRRMLTDYASTRPALNLLLGTIPTFASDLLAYWSLSEDGGEVLRDSGPLHHHGWIAGGVPRESGTLALDGERTAIQLEIEAPDERPEALGFNLGRDGVRICIRGEFMLGRQVEDIGAANIEDGLFETIAAFEDPEGESSDPFFALRVTTFGGNPCYYFRVRNGRETVVLQVDPAFLQPDPGRWVKLLFGIQRNNSGVGHRVYAFELDGEESARGWSDLIAFTEAPIEERDARRWSFGAEVVGIPAQGSGDANACLSRWREASIALRPGFDKRFGAVVVTNPALDPWTTLDRPEGAHDVLPPLAHDSLTVKVTRGSRAMQTSAGGAFASSFDSYPARYLLVLGSARVQVSDPEEGKEEESLVVAISSVDLSTAQMERAWSRADADALEARVLAWAWSLRFAAQEPEEVERPSLVALPPENELWALTDRWEDSGGLGLGSSKARTERRLRWSLAIRPSIPGSPQEFYRARWGEGCVQGAEPVRMVAQLRSELDEIIVGRGGSVFRVRPAWVRNGPDDLEGYGVRIRSVLPAIAELREERSSELLRRNRRRDPASRQEGIEWHDGANPVRLPSSGVGEAFYLFTLRITLQDTAGRQTLISRVSSEVSGGALLSLANLDFHLRDGVPVFAVVGAADRYEMRLGAGTPLGVRWNLPLGRPVTVGVQVGINWTGNAWLPGSFFLDGRKFSSTLVSGGLLPSAIPQPNVSTVLMGANGSYQSPSPIRFVLDGLIHAFQLESAGTEFSDLPPSIVAP